MARTRLLSIAAAAVIAAGCSGGASPTGPAAPALTTPAPATAAPVTPPPPTPAATTAPVAADLCAASDAAGGEAVAAGTYRYASSTPTFTLTLPDGYTVACGGSALSLFASDGAIVVVTGVGFVNEGGSPTKVGATIDAVQAAALAAAETATDPTPDTIGTLEAVTFVVTPTENGFVVKGTDERGWAFGASEAPDAAISIAEVTPGTVALVLRHADDPTAFGADVLASLDWE